MNYKDIPYSSILTGILFILSEILPFIPKTGNGFLHSIVELVKNKRKSTHKNDNNIDNIDNIENEEELECINTSERIIELKKKLNEINNEITEEMKKETDAMSSKSEDISTSDTEQNENKKTEVV